MKLFILIMIGLLAVNSSDVVYRKKHIIIDSECARKNVFLGKLAKNGVRIFQYPQRNGQKCQAEWESHLTCCETSSLEKYAIHDSGNIRDYMDQLVKEIKLAAYSLVLFVEKVQDFESYPVTWVKFKRLDTIEKIANFSKTEELKRSLGQDLIELREFVDELTEITKTFSSVQSKCANRMNSMRSSSLCFTCSGRSEVFFSENKAILDMKDCTNFIHDCFDAWTMLIQIMNGMKRGRDIVESVKFYYPDISYPYKGFAISKLIDWMENLGIQNDISLCKSKASLCDYETKKNICENILNLEEKTYLENSFEFLRSGRRDELLMQIDLFSNRKVMKDEKKEIKDEKKEEKKKSAIFNEQFKELLSEEDWKNLKKNDGSLTDTLVKEFDKKVLDGTLFTDKYKVDLGPKEKKHKKPLKSDVIKKKKDKGSKDSIKSKEFSIGSRMSGNKKKESNDGGKRMLFLQTMLYQGISSSFNGSILLSSVSDITIVPIGYNQGNSRPMNLPICTFP